MSLTEKTFKCWLPIQTLSKSRPDAEGKRWIQGIASTPARDLQGEVVNQSGIDVSYFLNHGYFNNDHKPGAENKVGEPTECKITKDGLWVKGFVYKDKKAADDIWEHITSLNKSGSRRRMGFSIEGKVISKNGATIEKCWIQDIAITPAPVNATTFAEVVKSLSANSSLAVESLEDELKKTAVSKGLTLEQTVAYIRSREPKLSFEAAYHIADLIFDTL